MQNLIGGLCRNRTAREHITPLAVGPCIVISSAFEPVFVPGERAMQPETALYSNEVSSRVWDVVGEHLESFAAAWETHGVPPDLSQFLPAEPPEVRRLVLIEIVKLDLDSRLQRGLTRPLEEYLQDFPELTASGLPCDLLYEDYQLRLQAGETVDAGDYYQRFPKQAAELGRLLGRSTPGHTTSLHAARAPLSVKPGDQLDDFDLLAMLGEGQFAKVFLARQRTMQRLVALKVSAHRGAEAQTLAQLDHPHIVRVYDQRVVPDRDVLLVYMPYLAGGTLHDVLDRVRKTPKERRSGRTLLEAVDASLDRRGEIPPASSSGRQAWAARSWPATVCALGVKLASALDYAHKHDVLHRDVKPANVLLTAEGEPLLADFNVGCCSKVEGAGPAAFFGGSLGYMAAEHLEAFNPDHERSAESLDGRADVFGLAVTLWELLTGERPFSAEQMRGNWPETLKFLVEQRQAGPKPEAIANFPEEDVPGFREVLLKCLETDPNKRPATAGEMARELDLCLRPATRRLVRPAPGGWRDVVKRHPLLTLYPLGLAPNMIASWFNIEYNGAQIIAPWKEAKDWFWPVIGIINTIFFPVGMLIFAMAFLPTMRGLRLLRKGTPLPPAELGWRRRWTLRLGIYGAASCSSCWAVAGVLFPFTLFLLAGPPKPGEEAAVFFHFFLSLVICGLIAGSYPYFLVTFLSVRVLFPALLGPDGADSEDAPALKRADRQLSFYSAAATLIPILGVALLVALFATRTASNATPTNATPEELELIKASQNMIIYALAAMCVVGVGGIALALFLQSKTRADLAALADLPVSLTTPRA